MIKNLIRNAVKGLLPEIKQDLARWVTDEVNRHLSVIFTLDPAKQYVIVVDSDDVARDLATEIKKRFKLPNAILVVSGADMQIIEIGKGKLHV